MSEFPKADAISRIDRPLDWSDDKNQLMADACREMAFFHQSHSPEIRALYQRHGFHPEMILKADDLSKIPSLGVTAMKYFLLTSRPEAEAVLKLTSSGTRGQKTQIWFDQDSLSRVQGMLDVLWQQEGLVSEHKTNYVNFIYDPEEAKDLGIAFSVKNEERFAPANKSVFVVKKNSVGAWEFRPKLAIDTLRAFAKEELPVRILGIPSFIFELLQALENEVPIQLPRNSFMLTGGGWKAAEDKQITREKFRMLVGERLGIPDENIRDGYGMAEHSAPYIECRAHRFHVPVYNRIVVRDPVTLKSLPDGSVGLLEFITPFNAMMPTLSILSTDVGKLNPDPCGCGWTAPTFTLLGRGGLVKHKGCAITAGEMVKRN